jgi:hypothetical protein
MLTTVALTPTDFKRWAEHLNRQIAESGQGGRPFFRLWQPLTSNRPSVVPASKMAYQLLYLRQHG